MNLKVPVNQIFHGPIIVRSANGSTTRGGKNSLDPSLRPNFDRDFRQKVLFPQLLGDFESAINGLSALFGEIGDTSRGWIPSYLFRRLDEHKQSQNFIAVELLRKTISLAFPGLSFEGIRAILEYAEFQGEDIQPNESSSFKIAEAFAELLNKDPSKERFLISIANSYARFDHIPDYLELDTNSTEYRDSKMASLRKAYIIYKEILKLNPRSSDASHGLTQCRSIFNDIKSIASIANSTSRIEDHPGLVRRPGQDSTLYIQYERHTN
jgi:hypothetical protein